MRCYTTYDWDKISDDFGKLTDIEIAQKHNISHRQIVYAFRMKHNIPGTTKSKRRWAGNSELVGLMPDRELAELVGITADGVKKTRLRYGEWTRTEKDLGFARKFAKTLRTEYYEYVVTDLGVIDILTDTCIYECKLSLTMKSLHQAIGQLICYSIDYPGRDLVIVTNENRLNKKAMKAAKKLNIKIIEAKLVDRSK